MARHGIGRLQAGLPVQLLLPDRFGCVQPPLVIVVPEHDARHKESEKGTSGLGCPGCAMRCSRMAVPPARRRRRLFADRSAFGAFDPGGERGGERGGGPGSASERSCPAAGSRLSSRRVTVAVFDLPVASALKKARVFGSVTGVMSIAHTSSSMASGPYICWPARRLSQVGSTAIRAARTTARCRAEQTA